MKWPLLGKLAETLNNPPTPPPAKKTHIVVVPLQLSLYYVFVAAATIMHSASNGDG